MPSLSTRSYVRSEALSSTIKRRRAEPRGRSRGSARQVYLDGEGEAGNAWA
jgi:hypothetical protein